MFLSLGILLFLVKLQVDGFALEPPTTIMCYHCDSTTNPERDCTTIQKCHRGEHICYAEVTVLNGVRHLSMGCKHENECQNTLLGFIIGKRERGHPHGTVLCRSCCHDTIGCNLHKCEQTFRPTLTTTTPTPVALAPCRDHLEGGFDCAAYDYLNFCTDTSNLAHKLAFERCPNHCGFCDIFGNFKPEYTTTTTTTPMPTTAAPCIDHESDGFYCADYDAYNFCNDTTNAISYKLAMERCPKHCGFCGANNNGGILAASIVVNPTITAAPATVTTGASIGAVTQITQNCFDDEDDTFNCAQWASYGFCLSVQGTGHDIAVARCSKYCGFCS